MDIDSKPSAPPAASLPPPSAPAVPPPQPRAAPQPPAAKPLWSRSVASTPKPAAASAFKPPPPSTNGAFATNGAANGAAVEVDDAAMADAQKHAKWAISALNFEDVPTAIKELKIALAALGGA